MGYRAYVVKPGSVDEYTNSEYFNRMACELLELFDTYNIRYDNGLFKRKEMWTIKDAELNALIAILEESPNEVDECFSESKSYTNQEVADVFKEWAKYADKESGLVRIHWF
jgi:hypothetical protein